MTPVNISWQQTDFAGKAAHVFEPPKITDPPNVSIFLYGSGDRTIVDHPHVTAALQEHPICVLCLGGGESWWLDRICPRFDPDISAERFLLEDGLAEVARRWGVQPPQIALWGIGTGGQAVLRLAFRQPRMFPVVAALLPSIDFHLLYGRGTALDQMFPSREAARQETAILYVHALNWPRHLFFAADPADSMWFDSARRLHEKLSAVGVPHECDLQTTCGHDPGRYLTQLGPHTVEFLVQRLQKERLRIV